MATKKEENKMLIPPDGGEWVFVMRVGNNIKGQLMERFDDGIIISPSENVFVAIFTADILSMWQGLPDEEPEAKPEA